MRGNLLLKRLSVAVELQWSPLHFCVIPLYRVCDPESRLILVQNPARSYARVNPCCEPVPVTPCISMTPAASRRAAGFLISVSAK